MSNYSLIIFDFDGTLVDTLPVNWNAIRTNLARLSNSEDAQSLSITQYVDSIRSNKMLFNQSINIIEKYEEEALKKGMLNSKVYNLFKLAKIKSINTAIFSTNCKRTILGYLQENEIDQPDFIIALEDVEKSKPNPEGIIKIMNQFNEIPQHTLFIGDSTKDKESAKSAGCTYIPVESNLLDNITI